MPSAQVLLLIVAVLLFIIAGLMPFFSESTKVNFIAWGLAAFAASFLVVL
jgi:hypothetical protein